MIKINVYVTAVHNGKPMIAVSTDSVVPSWWQQIDSIEHHFNCDSETILRLAQEVEDRLDPQQARIKELESQVEAM